MATNKLIFNLNPQYLQNSFPKPTISSTPSCFLVRGPQMEFNCGCSSSKLEHLERFEGLIENVSSIRMEKEKAEGECDKGLATHKEKHNLVKADLVPSVKRAMHGNSTRMLSTPAVRSELCEKDLVDMLKEIQCLFLDTLFSVSEATALIWREMEEKTLAAVNMDGQELTETMQKTTSSLSYANTTSVDDGTPTPPPHYKWRLLISYDGTRYAGWQFQVSPPTIQCLVEKALMKITKLEREDLHFVGASRTDTGVHAWGQVAHFITPFKYDSLETIHAALNGLLPSDIRVREISAAVPEFHARFSAKGKIYHYKIYNDSIMDPFQRHYAYHSVYKLNTAAMREAAKLFVGKHDFSAFVNASRNDRVPDPVKTIFRFDVVEMGDLLQLEVEGSGFLYRQVRNMVALLIQIGKEAIPPDIVPKILASQDRRELAKYALSAPPHGLYLVAVKYKDEHLRLPSGSPATSFGRYHTVSKCKLPFY